MKKLNLPVEVEKTLMDWVSDEGKLLQAWEGDFGTYYIVWMLENEILFLRLFPTGMTNEKIALSQDGKYIIQEQEINFKY
jgi:hypothetical protein